MGCIVESRGRIEAALKNLAALEDNYQTRLALNQEGYGFPPALLDSLKQKMNEALAELAKHGIDADSLESALVKYNGLLSRQKRKPKPQLPSTAIAIVSPPKEE